MNICTKPFLIFVMLCLATSLFSQDWAPMRMGERYNYQQDSAGVITQTLWADSATVINGDSVWYSNMTYAAVKDTFQGWLDEHIVFDSPFFLQKTIRKITSAHYQLTDTALFDLQLFQGPGGQWMFDPANQDMATVSAASDSLLWGMVRDSVKYIQLSSGGELIASKYHGILYWDVLGRQMALVGMQGNKVLGEQVPMFDDFYGDAFEVGDEMEWMDADLYGFEFWHTKFIFTSKDNNSNDSIKVVSDQYTRHAYRGPNTFSYLNGRRTSYVDSVNHIANSWPGQMAGSSPSGPGGSHFTLAPVALLKTKQGKLIKCIGLHSNISLPNVDQLQILALAYYFPLAGSSYSTAGEVLYRSRDYLQYAHNYHEGLGFLSWSGSGFEFNRFGSITGYLHQGDTIIGSIRPNTWWVTGIENTPGSISLKAYPNPASGSFTIECEPSHQSGKLDLLDLSGKRLTSWEIAPNQSDQTLTIPKSVKPSMYVLRLERGDQRGIFRMVVK